MNLPLALNWARRSLFKRGLVRTGKVAGNVILDLTFDLWYNTDTMGWVWTEDLGAHSEHDKNAVGYRASKAGPLRKLIRRLDLPREWFIDLGSGKGKVLLLAAQLGFQRVIGVEFSPLLCAIARKNAGIFTRQLTNITSCIEVINSDVAHFDIPPEPCVIYAYNPFDEVVMEKFIANLQESLKRFPRQVWFIYNTPLHAGVVETLFRNGQDFEIGGTDFRVWKSI